MLWVQLMMLASHSFSEIGRWKCSTHRMQVIQSSGDLQHSVKKLVREPRAVLRELRLDCSPRRRFQKEKTGWLSKERHRLLLVSVRRVETRWIQVALESEMSAPRSALTVSIAVELSMSAMTEGSDSGWVNGMEMRRGEGWQIAMLPVVPSGRRSEGLICDIVYGGAEAKESGKREDNNARRKV